MNRAPSKSKPKSQFKSQPKSKSESDTKSTTKSNSKLRPTRGRFSIFRQICDLIPAHLVPQLARETGVDKKARTFSPWSHLVSLIYCQLAHCLSLNDVCDALHLQSGPLSALRGATPPNRNTLSNSE